MVGFGSCVFVVALGFWFGFVILVCYCGVVWLLPEVFIFVWVDVI